MKEFFYATLNDMAVVSVIILATKIAERSILCGIIAYFAAYICLDYHTYISKKLNFTNNLFIH